MRTLRNRVRAHKIEEHFGDNPILHKYFKNENPGIVEYIPTRLLKRVYLKMHQIIYYIFTD